MLLLPAVTERALFEAFTALLIACDECSALPVLAQFSLISKKVWFSPKILEIMRIDTLRFVVLMIVGAPFCFEEEDVKIEVGMLRHQVMN